MVSLGSSQYPLSKHVTPLCEITHHHQFIRSIRSMLKTIVLIKREISCSYPSGDGTSWPSPSLWLRRFKKICTREEGKIRDLKRFVSQHPIGNLTGPVITSAHPGLTAALKTWGHWEVDLTLSFQPPANQPDLNQSETRMKLEPL